MRARSADLHAGARSAPGNVADRLAIDYLCIVPIDYLWLGLIIDSIRHGCSRKPRLHHTEISSLSEVPVSCWSSSRARASASQKVVREAAAEPVERKGVPGRPRLDPSGSPRE